MNFRVCCVYLLDSQFITDVSKFFAGTLTAMSAMVQLEIPHVNILSKMDLLEGKQHQDSSEKDPNDIEKFLDVDTNLLLSASNGIIRDKWSRLNEALAHLISDFNMVSYFPLNIKDENSISDILLLIDDALQYGENAEPKEPNSFNEDDYQ
jgi:hypothetical protein